MSSRLGSHLPRAWQGAFAPLSLASSTSGCGGSASKAPAGAGDAPLPTPAYEAALPEGVRAHLFERFTGDFDQMAARRLIRVGTTFNRTFYFVDNGVQRGATYERGRAFEEQLNKKLETTDATKISVVSTPLPRDLPAPALTEGKADCVVAQIIVRPELQALAILAVLFRLTVLPGRVRLLPVWFPFVVVIVVLLPMAGVALAAARARWLRVERAITLLFVALMGLATLSVLAYLVRTMVKRPGDIGGLQLLTSSIAVWVTNVLLFSLLYWRMDRGGPEARANDAGTKPDWLFPQSEAPEDAPPDWRPTFVDYLFLAYSTATAFSPTDAMPLTSRAKMLMMLESSISLSTLVVVASRAINILGA